MEQNSDEIDSLVDWQLNNPPTDTAWSCPDCGMNWTEQPTQCPCQGVHHSEPGQPNAATLELCFWEALKRCVLDPDVPIAVELRTDDDDSTELALPNPIPQKFWEYMAAAHAELAAAAGVS